MNFLLNMHLYLCVAVSFNFREMRYRFFMALIFLTGMIVPLGVDAQLFPETEKLHGKISRIKEKHYGRTTYHFLGIRIFPYKLGYRPNAFSGWKYAYYYDDQNKLIKELRTNRGKLALEYAFSEDTLSDTILRRETYLRCQNVEERGNYYEYEYVMRSGNLVQRVNCWSYKANSNKRELNIIESNTQYEKGLLCYYTREGVRNDGSIYHLQTYKIYYDSLNRVSLIEEWNDGYKFKEMEAPLSGITSEMVVDSTMKVRSVWKFTYNLKGQLENRLFENVNRPDTRFRDFNRDELYYVYDKQGNWIERYRKYDDGERRLETKRKIKYKK